jgi:hypothetical protein
MWLLRQEPLAAAAAAERAERAAADPGKDPEVAERITVSSELVRIDHSPFFISIEKIHKNPSKKNIKNAKLQKKIRNKYFRIATGRTEILFPQKK